MFARPGNYGWRVGFVCLLVLTGAKFAPAQEAAAKPIRVAIYDHSGARKDRPGSLGRFLNERNGFTWKRVSPAEIRDGALKNFDVLIMPGGSASRQAKNLGERGRDQIRKFVGNGGGYVGICAGSYLASPGYDWSLGIINTKVVDRKHWARGTGEVQIQMTRAGKAALGESSDKVKVYYGQGPLMAPGSRKDLPAYEALATYDTGIAKHGAPRGVMPGTTAIARAPYHDGRVVCISPHPEASGGPNHLVMAAVRWAAHAE